MSHHFQINGTKEDTLKRYILIWDELPTVGGGLGFRVQIRGRIGQSEDGD